MKEDYQLRFKDWTPFIGQSRYYARNNDKENIKYLRREELLTTYNGTLLFVATIASAELLDKLFNITKNLEKLIF